MILSVSTVRVLASTCEIQFEDLPFMHQKELYIYGEGGKDKLSKEHLGEVSIKREC